LSSSLLLLIVGLAILASLGFDIWLDRRQIRWLAAHRDDVPAAFAGRVTPEEHRRAVDYAVERLRLSMLDSVVGAALSALLLIGGLFAALTKLATEIAGPGYVAGLLLVGAVMLIYAVLEIPFAAWRTFRIEQRYGFNRTTVGVFVADLAKGAVLAVAIGAPFILAIDYIMRHAGTVWWLAGWGFYIAFSLLMLLIVPRFIMPLFNKFEPIDDAALRTRIETLLARCGFHASGLFKMDGSKRSSHGNAFFTGFGPTKRIVLFDTILSSLTPSEIEAVLAHELGHFKLRHIVKRMATGFAVSLAAFAVIGYLVGSGWFAAGFGIAPEIAQAMPLVALILCMLVMPAFTGWTKGISNWRSRLHEWEADAYAARQTNGADLASALLKLHKDNASPGTTDPIYSAFKYSHPPTAERIARLQQAA
jgi:STE24 endopeptidase